MISNHLRRFLTGVSFLVIALVMDASAADEIWDIPNVWSGHRKPMIDLTYGVGQVNQRLFQGTLADVSMFDVKLGYFRARPDTGSNIVHLDDKFLSFSYSASDLSGRSISSTEVGSTLVRFGTGARTGYAYDFTNSFLYPYQQTSYLWTKLTTKRPSGLSVADTEILNRYEGTFRFGASTEGGIALGIGDLVSLRLGYEAAVIYPRYVFWPWLGSYALAGIGMGAISHFGKVIVDASPTLGPFIYALLRSALAYGYYLTVRDDQYWPFRSETPMTTTTVKFGVSFTF